MNSGADTLRDWLKRRSLNQSEAAKLLGFTEVYLSQILNGHRKPALANAVKIEKHTGIPVESWLSESGDDDAEIPANVAHS